ncbi:hypothetical protein R3P38DRAFT_3415316 [Favolaschia claudopus]|uniref:Uncharacterized protein n=1 Tax=Favolaschia claudopus TaxID=2862362 RepID=A0AAW0EHB0_9AGAR
MRRVPTREGVLETFYKAAYAAVEHQAQNQKRELEGGDVELEVKQRRTKGYIIIHEPAPDIRPPRMHAASLPSVSHIIEFPRRRASGSTIDSAARDASVSIVVPVTAETEVRVRSMCASASENEYVVRRSRHPHPPVPFSYPAFSAGCLRTDTTCLPPNIQRVSSDPGPPAYLHSTPSHASEPMRAPSAYPHRLTFPRIQSQISLASHRREHMRTRRRRSRA